MSIILSHATARLFHASPLVPRNLPRIPEAPATITHGAPSARLVARARELLVGYGVPPDQLETLDILVATRSDRRSHLPVRCHLFQHPLPAQSLIRLDAGIYVVDVRLCALLSAGDLSELELTEYYFYLCSAFALPLDLMNPLVTIEPRTSVRELSAYIAACSPARYTARALACLSCVLDGARSPLEIAVVMPLVVPRRLGGLGLKTIRLNHRVEVPERLRGLTRRKWFYLDIYEIRGRQDIEYQGREHEQDGAVSVDHERENALRAMGFALVNISRTQLFDTVAFRRVLTSICKNAGIRTDRFSASFLMLQEQLRQFVVRRWRPSV